MAQAKPLDIKSAKAADRDCKSEPLEARYGAIGCAAVKAASLQMKKSAFKNPSKGFASQSHR
jgi:hypothetical protein